MNLNTLANRFFTAHKGNLSQATFLWYKYYTRPLLTKYGETAIADISIEDLRELYAELADKTVLYEHHPHEGRQPIQAGYSQSTLHCYGRSWKRLFKWGSEEGYLENNPAKRLYLPDLSNPHPKVLQPEDFTKLLAMVHQSSMPERDEAILRFLADTSARLGGAAGLCLKDLHVDEGWATVVEKGKGGGKVRSVFFEEQTRTALQAWLAVRPSQADKRVFLLGTSGISQMIERLAEVAEVSDAHNPHAFRHAFALGMLGQGANLAQVSQLMGHSSVIVTVKYYGQFPSRDLQEFHKRYSRFSKTDASPKQPQKSEEVPKEALNPAEDLDEIIPIPRAVKLAEEKGFQLTASTIYYAARVQNIRDAVKYGRDWVFSRGEFLKWLFNRYAPKPKRKN